MSAQQLYIGIMSGTSLDGVDVVLVDFSLPFPQLLGSQLLPFDACLRTVLAKLSQPGSNEIEIMGLAEADLAECFATAVQRLLEITGYTASQIIAIGCHGQTIRHRPQGRQPFSYQIGDMHRLAALTGIRVIADFRRKDIAFGGQGAPLVPAFHQAVFSSPQTGRCILNIGGIANVTLLLPNAHILGFDTGPGNCLLDNWIEQHQGLPFDEGGQFAAKGQINEALLQACLSDTFFQQQGPKSTGREYFQLAWLQSHLAHHDQHQELSAADVQRTLCRFTAATIAQAIQSYPLSEVFVCGGGAFNPVLLADLQTLMPHCRIANTLELGVAPDWVEAMAFAWLAYAYDQRLFGNVPAVTGARQALVLGQEFNPN